LPLFSVKDPCDFTVPTRIFRIPSAHLRSSTSATSFFVWVWFGLVLVFWDRICLCNSGWLAWNLLHRPHWPWTHDLPASTSWVLELQMCTTTSSLLSLFCSPGSEGSDTDILGVSI
jgi:hypothetical protein